MQHEIVNSKNARGTFLGECKKNSLAKNRRMALQSPKEMTFFTYLI